MTIDLQTLTIHSLHDALTQKQYSVQEVVSAYQKNIDEKNDELNVYLHTFTDIDEQVARAQEMIDTGVATALTGVPMAIKANIQVKGQVCNAASRMLENYTAVYDATAIARLREQGVVFLGSVNMDEFAMGGSTENSAFGPTKNPHDVTRVPGGTSGGSAAAVAADMALIGIGSDTGGSIRQPGSFCGVVGFKGSYGSVSRYGAAAMGSSLDQISPAAKNVTDAQLVWQAMRGSDSYDMTSLPDETWQQTEAKELYSIAVPKNFLEGVDSEVLDIYNQSVEKLRNAGHRVDEIEIDSMKYALPVYYIVMPAEVSSNLARFDGIRYGYKAEDTKGLTDEYIKTRSVGFGSEAKRRIILGTYVLSAGYSDQYYTRALALREKMKTELNQVFEQYDAIITPTSPVLPFKIGEKSNDPLAMYLADIYTVGANIAGIPGISVPAGMSNDNLPVGIQFLAKKTDDEKLLDIAKKFESIV